MIRNMNVKIYSIIVISFILNGFIDLNAQNAGFDTTQYHPVYIQSKDAQFKLNLGLYTQFRYNVNHRLDTPDSVPTFTNGYNQARTRIFLEGDLTSKFYYHLRTNINPSGDVELFVSYLQWNINKKMNIRMGRQFMALGREDWMYPQDLASMEFSAQDFTFAIWSSFGFQFKHTPSNYFRYWVGIGNGVYGGRRPYPAPKDSDVLLNARAEWNIVGADWGIWDDMLGRKGQPFGMLLGVGGAHNQRFDEKALITQPKNGSQLNIDYSISGNGFHGFAHGTFTNLQYKNPATNNNTYGFYATFGYWFTKKIFAYARFDHVDKGTNQNATENYTSPGIGCSLYPFTLTNRVRFTAEYNYLSNPVNHTLVHPDGQLGVVESSYGGQQSFRIQIQFGF